MPAGAVQTFAMSSAPTGWLSCDGSTTFNVPDLRGEFIRGWDAGRGIDSGRSFGSAQADEFKAHDHDVSWTAAEGGSGAGSRVENYNSGYINRATETVVVMKPDPATSRYFTASNTRSFDG